MSIRGVLIVVGPYSLTFHGLEDDAAPLEVVVHCVRCRGELRRRAYRVDGPEAWTQLVARAGADAEADALRGLAHQCGERN